MSIEVEARQLIADRLEVYRSKVLHLDKHLEAEFAKDVRKTDAHSIRFSYTEKKKFELVISELKLLLERMGRVMQ